MTDFSKLLLTVIAILVAAALPISQLSAADIAGIVQNAIPEYATVTTNSDLIPLPGDKVEIFFKIPGADAEISVASGHVYEITGGNIMVKIDNATGTVAKDQLVRINSPNPKKKEAVTSATSAPATSSSPPPPPALATQPPSQKPGASPPGRPHTASKTASQQTDLVRPSRQIVGTWQGARHRTQYFADGTFVVDPQLARRQPRGHWDIQGDRLVEYAPGSGAMETHRIISLGNRELVLADDQGRPHRKTRVSK